MSVGGVGGTADGRGVKVGVGGKAVGVGVKVGAGVGEGVGVKIGVKVGTGVEISVGRGVGVGVIVSSGVTGEAQAVRVVSTRLTSQIESERIFISIFSKYQ